MPLDFTDSQVRSYLKELGYAQIPGSQLQEFIHDLKKLIRHEEKRSQRMQRSEPDVRVTIEEVQMDESESNVSLEQRRAPLMPTTSFIRPRGPVSRPKGDPLMLHKEYKAYWDSLHFPGDDSSKGLRWAIRERMMGPE